MAFQNTQELVREAGGIFAQLGREVDSLAAEESTGALQHLRAYSAAEGFRRQAEQASAKLNRAAPRLNMYSGELFRKTSLMLSEITCAPTPEITMERYHDRRADIEAGLIRLAE